MAASIGGASYSRSVFFQIALARWAASSEPSSCHCSKLLLSATSRAVERALEVGQRVGTAEVVRARLVGEDRVEGLAVVREVHAVRRRRLIIPHWSASMMNFS